ncbi:MAG: hypothetical protein ABIQ82_09420 [Variovorax sp.]
MNCLRRNVITVGLLLALGLAAGARAAPLAPKPDELPLYGGVNRAQIPELKVADERFIAEVSAQYGSREKAARVWTEQGFMFYQKNNLDMAVRRFNQAWLLDPGNAEPYAGFASVLHDQGKICDAMRMMNEALKRNPPSFQGIYPDAARITTLCAVNDKALAPTAQEELLGKAEALYVKAEQIEPDKRYVYSSWATAYYWRGLYTRAWSMVARERAAGGQPADGFLRQLRAKMPEPSLP